MLTRRRLLAAGCACALTAACGPAGSLVDTRPALRLTAEPGEPGGPPPEPGPHPLGVAAERDALLHLPPALPAGSVPLVVTLHGAGGDAAGGLGLLQGLADEYGLVLLAPASRGDTWDAVLGRPGPDVEVIDRALAAAIDVVPVDPARIAVAGFSDGASYALGLGLANGDLFGRVLAFSPGFVPPDGRTGRPAIFVSHGDDDTVLPIDRTSRALVPALREDGYDVTYREFDGPHALPPEIAREGVEWLGWGRAG
ncbi:MAG TPA: alpha/beta hydrolase-fold protein [Geodermatophilus sp.]|nr:alpha/beta hydrolase-fold protein [Geodermatophilus sp.]